jgi:hypothetical protein
MERVKNWEIIADNLSKAGWSWGCVSAIDREGRTLWIVDAHRDDGKRFVVRPYEKLIAFMELESAIRAARQALISLEVCPQSGKWLDKGTADQTSKMSRHTYAREK